MAYWTTFKDPVTGQTMSAEIINGQGFVGGKRITDYYADLGYDPVWIPSDTPVEGGAYGTYSFTKRNQDTDKGSSGRTASSREKQYYVPGQQALEDAIAGLNFTPRSTADIRKEATTRADLRINPQLTALKAALDRAISDADSRKRSIEANYANVPATSQRLLEEAHKAGTESAIARGGGRSGAVEYSVEQMKKPIHESVMLAESKKAADLSAIDQALSAIQEQYSTAVQALEAQRGDLIAAEMAALEAGDRELANAIANQRIGALYNLSSLLANADQFNKRSVLDEAQISGKFPGIPEGTVTLRDYLIKNGFGEPGWDPSTGNVTINGKTYTAKQLEDSGGYIQNGRWQLPESVIKAMLQ
jgi:hypothetical protein